MEFYVEKEKFATQNEKIIENLQELIKQKDEEISKLKKNAITSKGKTINVNIP